MTSLLGKFSSRFLTAFGTIVEYKELLSIIRRMLSNSLDSEGLSLTDVRLAVTASPAVVGLV